MKMTSTALLAGLLIAAPAFGQLVAIGTSTGVITKFSASTTGQSLYLTVDNTVAAPGNVTGSVTAFGFNTPWAPPLNLSKVALSYAVLSSTGPTKSWNTLSTFQLNAGGFGSYVLDLGAESDNNGNPNGNDVKNGVEFGEKVVFKFDFDLAAYPMPVLADMASFFNQNPTGHDFLVRWQGVGGDTFSGGSDAFGGDWPGGYDIPQGGAVPEASTYGLFGAAALLAVVGRRFLRRRTA